MCCTVGWIFFFGILFFTSTQQTASMCQNLQPNTLLGENISVTNITLTCCVLAGEVENRADLWSGPFPLHWATSYFEGHLIFGSKKQHYCTLSQSLVYIVNILVHNWGACCRCAWTCMALMAGWRRKDMFMYMFEVRETAASLSLFINLFSYLCLLCQMLLLFWMFAECTVHHLMCTFPYYVINKMFYDPGRDHVLVSCVSHSSAFGSQIMHHDS